MYLDFLLIGALALGLVSATPAPKSATYSLSFPRAPSPNVNTTNFFSLTRHVKHRKHHKRSGHQGRGIAPLSTDYVQLSWLVDVKIGQQTVKLQVDTGSADTWVVNATYSCFAVSNDTYGEITNISLPQSACDFGPGYKAGKDYKVATDEHFYTWYGNGETVYGEFGKVPVTIGGVTVTQQVAVADLIASPPNGGVSSGILGLGYPDATNAFTGPPGTDYHLDNFTARPITQVLYNSFIWSLWDQHVTPPVFSIAISRPSTVFPNLPDGYLALGGLPPVAGLGAWATVPLENTPSYWYIQGVTPQPSKEFYVITTDEISYPNIPKSQLPANVTNGFKTLIDVGVPQNYLPKVATDYLASLYQPPAVFDDDLYSYVVPCDAIPPAYAIKIGGVTFPIDAKDMFIDDETGTGGCISSLAPSTGLGTIILGDGFLKSVIAVFDVGASEFRLRSRGNY